MKIFSIKQFRVFLIILLAILLLGILITYILYLQKNNPIHENFTMVLDENNSPYVKKLTYAQLGDGVKKLMITTENANYNEISNQISMIKAKIDYSPNKDNLVIIAGDQGEYNQKKQLAILRGNVCGYIHDGLILKTEYLQFIERGKILNTNSWISLVGNYFKITSKGVMAILPQGIFMFKKQVNYTFIPLDKKS